MLLVGIGIIAGVTGLIFGLFQGIKSPTDPARALPLVLLGLAATLVIGLGGMVLITYLIGWSMAPERERFARSTQVLKQTLPNLPVEGETKAAEQAFSGKMILKLIVLLPLYLLATGLLIVGIKKGFEGFFPDAPDWVSDLVFLVTFWGGNWLISHLRNKRGAQTAAQGLPPH